MIDTHCHLTYKPLYDRIEAVLHAADEAGVDRMISVGTCPDDAQLAVALAETYSHIYATAGVHPHYAAKWMEDDRLERMLGRLLDHPRVVAMGEMGLDRHYGDPPLEVQRSVLRRQLDVAGQIRETMPIVIHNREATDEVLAELRRSKLAPHRFVFHCFTGNSEELAAILQFGAMVSFTGIVTFGNARQLSQDAATVPIDRIMVETDSPYLTPEPHRKHRPNEPRFVPFVAEHLASQRGMKADIFVAKVDANAERFFGLEA